MPQPRRTKPTRSRRITMARDMYARSVVDFLNAQRTYNFVTRYKPTLKTDGTRKSYDEWQRDQAVAARRLQLTMRKQRALFAELFLTIDPGPSPPYRIIEPYCFPDDDGDDPQPV